LGRCPTIAECLQVEELERATDLQGPRHTELLTVNEHLERMLLKLDDITGLEGEGRQYKKDRVAEIDQLCTRCDALKKQVR
jgi:BAG domain